MLTARICLAGLLGSVALCAGCIVSDGSGAYGVPEPIRTSPTAPASEQPGEPGASDAAARPAASPSAT